ncbi:MAG: O-antigen ligase family protein [Akkermansiaceae bacterium]|nr:O-antigen ligase family protein [Akkermansiaceae bacterium]
MSPSTSDRLMPCSTDHRIAGPGTPLVFGAFWGLVLLATFFVNGPWAGFHGILLGCVGLLMLVRPPDTSLPALWWVLAGVFLVAGSAVWLPANWFLIPAWRTHLTSLGVETGDQVVIQSRQALELFTLFGVTLFTGLWLAGHRPSATQLRRWAMIFTLGVAAYAIISRLIQIQPDAGPGGHFGFFPNRNHSATYLAMGAVCGLGTMLQALRDRRFPALATALGGTAICLWAIAAWSLSRGGIVLVGIGAVLWISILGRHYLGRHGIWALGLIALAAAGLFFIADSGVKERLTLTMEKAGELADPGSPSIDADGKSAIESVQSLDLRIPIALDTLGLIRDFKWTGVGAGQYRYVFPQYRERSAVRNDSESYHPESDWLWMAAEAGVPATLALAALVLLGAWKSLRSIRSGRQRAVRGACLIAAMLVAIHGIFDVPGHRITLAWSAVFLFALSLHCPTASASPAAPRAWPFRLAALPVLLLAGLLLHSQWGAGYQPAVVAGDAACGRAMALYQQDQTLQKEATAAGKTHDPPAGEDLLEQAVTGLKQATRDAPMDRRLYHLRGYITLYFDDLEAETNQAFEIERALDPTWIKGPLQQATAWSRTSPRQTELLWQDALQRAGWMDEHHPGSPYNRANTLKQIRHAARGNPQLEAIAERVHSER